MSESGMPTPMPGRLNGGICWDWRTIFAASNEIPRMQLVGEPPGDTLNFTYGVIAPVNANASLRASERNFDFVDAIRNED